MSRSGYSDDCDDNWAHIKWRGVVASSIRGKRGQLFLKELLEALDAMPQKRLIRNELRFDGDVCALGSVGVKRGIELESIDPEDYKTLSETFNIAGPLIQEIEWINDDAYYYVESPESRWCRVRAWVSSKISGAAP